MIEEVVVFKGQPLVIQNFHQLPTFDQQLFTLDWLKSNIGDNEVRIRDLRTKKDTNLKFNEFMAMNQHKHYSEIHYYGKDLDCPHEWQISGQLPLPANVMGQAKFPIFAFEQRLGDFVMRGGHQVVNLGRGGTIKYSWNRKRSLNRRILKMETTDKDHGSRGAPAGALAFGKDLESVEPSLLATYAEIISYDVVDTSYAIQKLQRPGGPMPDATYRGALTPRGSFGLCHRPVEECFRDLQRLGFVNTSPVLSPASFKPVPTYPTSRKRDRVPLLSGPKGELENLHPAVRNNDKLKIADHKLAPNARTPELRHGVLRRLKIPPLSQRVPAQTGMRWTPCGGAPEGLALLYARAPETAQSGARVRRRYRPPPGGQPLPQKDFNGNYYGLRPAFPVGTTNYLKGMDKATAKNVQEKLIPSRGPIYNMPKDSPGNRREPPKKLKDASAHEASEGMGKPGAGVKGKTPNIFKLFTNLHLISELIPSTPSLLQPPSAGGVPPPKATSSPPQAAPQAPMDQLRLTFRPYTLAYFRHRRLGCPTRRSGRPHKALKLKLRRLFRSQADHQGRPSKRGPYKKRVTVPKVSDEGASSNDAKNVSRPEA
ncbi:hypothetical protein L0F63_007423 [Massospora cicadina]|nr:hypothetical protein L0F63_007423 [Massospora cicadina]